MRLTGKRVARRRIGAHLSIGDGYAGALDRIVTIGGNCLQIFSASPRGWKFATVSEKEAGEFRAKKEELGVDPVYFHASYLINLASDEAVGDLSERSLVAELSVAEKIGARGSVVHLGSFKGAAGGERERQYGLLIRRIKEILKQTPKETLFIAENAGTRKIGQTLEELAQVVRDVGDKRLRVCLDTCHLHAAGYDLRTAAALEKFLDFFDRIIGFPRLELFHVNDSRDPFGSLRDRHDNIGEGMVGRSVFSLLLNHDKTKNLPFIIETPGFNGMGPDKENIDRLREMVTGQELFALIKAPRSAG